MKEFFKNLTEDVKASVIRFFPAFCLTVMLFIVGVYVIIFEPDGDVAKVMARAALAIGFGILLCTLGKILLERFGDRINGKGSYIEWGLVILSAPMFFALKGFEGDRYVAAGYFGVVTALLFGIAYFCDIQGISKTFSCVLKNTVFNCITCGIVTAGTSLSIFAFYSLIYEFGNDYKVYAINALFIWAVLFLNLSLSAIPRMGAELKTPNLFKIIVMYVALPVYMLLIAILYIYLGKILATFTFPSGKINWFASFASLLFIFFVLALEQYKHENRFAAGFVKFGGFGIIPIIVVQFMAIYIRLSNYGLTAPRYVSVVLNSIAIAFAVVSLIREGRYCKQMLLVVAAAAILLTLTPLNLFDVPIRDQTARLTHVLSRNNMLNNGAITANADISGEDKIDVTSAYNYLYSNREKETPDIIQGIEGQDFKTVFGFDMTYENSGHTEVRGEYVYYGHSYDFVDISGYGRLYPVSSHIYGGGKETGTDGTLSLNIGGKPVDFDIQKAVEELYAVHGEKAEDVVMEYDVDGGRLLFTQVHFNVRGGDITVNFCEGYLLTDSQ